MDCRFEVRPANRDPIPLDCKRRDLFIATFNVYMYSKIGWASVHSGFSNTVCKGCTNSFESKREFFFSELKKVNHESNVKPPPIITVERSHLVEDAFTQMRNWRLAVW